MKLEFFEVNSSVQWILWMCVYTVQVANGEKEREGSTNTQIIRAYFVCWSYLSEWIIFIGFIIYQGNQMQMDKSYGRQTRQQLQILLTFRTKCTKQFHLRMQTRKNAIAGLCIALSSNWIFIFINCTSAASTSCHIKKKYVNIYIYDLVLYIVIYKNRAKWAFEMI